MRNIKEILFLLTTVIAQSLVLGCEQKALREFEKPAFTKQSSTPTNYEIATCANNLDNNPYRFSLSPNGRFILELKDIKTNRDHDRYVKDGVSYSPIHSYVLKESKVRGDIILEDLKEIEMVSLRGKQPFFWTYTNELFYQDINKDRSKSGQFSLLELDNIDSPSLTLSLSVTNQNPNFNINRLSNPMAINRKNLLSGLSKVAYGNWSVNVFFKPALRISTKRESNHVNVQLNNEGIFDRYLKHYLLNARWRGRRRIERKTGKYTERPTLNEDDAFRTILTYDSLADHVTIIENNLFQPYLGPELIAENQYLDFPSSNHFYFLSNKDRNTVSLSKFVESQGSDQTKDVYSNDNFDVNHVSMNRLGDAVNWIIIDKGLPEHIIVNNLAQKKFDLVDIPYPHASEIISESLHGHHAIIKRTSLKYGIEYILVDVTEEKTKILSACLNRDLSPWADVEEVQFMTSDGQTVWGQIYKPPNADTPRPTIIYAHGGPSFQQKLAWDNLYFKSLVDEGYNVIAINYRGSLGYGREFREQGWVNFERPRLDLIESGQYASQRNDVDSKKLYLMGNSYGGYLALAVATLEENHPFLAVISRNGMSDLDNFLTDSFIRPDGTSFKYNDVSDVFGNTNDADNLAYLRRNSPISAIGRFNTPIFLAHAKGDAKVPSRQSRDFYKKVIETDPDYNIQLLELEGGHAIEGLDGLKRYIDASIRFIETVD